MMYFWVMLGSALGGGARYLFSGVASHQFGETFPWGTLIVNVTSPPLPTSRTEVFSASSAAANSFTVAPLSIS